MRRLGNHLEVLDLPQLWPDVLSIFFIVVAMIVVAVIMKEEDGIQTDVAEGEISSDGVGGAITTAQEPARELVRAGQMGEDLVVDLPWERGRRSCHWFVVCGLRWE